MDGLSSTATDNDKANAYREAARALTGDAHNGPLAVTDKSFTPEAMENNRLQYIKPKYDASGWNPQYTGTFLRSRADSLYVVPYYTEITKTIPQKRDTDGRTKDTYDLDRGERYVDFKLAETLQFSKDGASFANGINKTTITITDTLPKGLSYVKNSAVWSPVSYTQQADKPGICTGGERIEPKITKEDDGTTKLVWTIKDVVVSADIHDLYYTSFINKNVKNNDQLKNTVQIRSSDENRVISDYNRNQSEAGLSVTKSSAFNINKFGDPDLELNDKATFTLVASNSTDNDRNNFLLVDAMPYDGKEYKGIGTTSMKGKYNVTSITINDDPDIIGENGTNDIDIYYTDSKDYAGLSDFSKINLDEIKTDSAKWKKALKTNGSADEDPSWDVSGWPTAVVIADGKLAGNTTLIATVHYEAKADRDDHLVNYLMAADSSNNPIHSNSDAVIYSRDLSGTVWIDDNFNGLMDDGEERVPGVKVQLQHKNDNGEWEIVNTYTGTDGKEHQASTVTDANGFYKFDKLRKGTDYRVVFTSGNTPESDLSQYYMTNQNAGDDTTKTSKTNHVDGKVSEGDITGISMPTIEEMKKNNTSHYSLPDQNMGLYRVRRTISGTAWFDANGDGIYQKDATDGTKEYPMKGVEVSLYRKDKDGNYVPYKVSGKEVTTTTDSNGQYVFEKLPEGEYEVVFNDGKGHNAKISEFNVTLPDQGTDPGVRSIADAGKDGTAAVSRQNGSTDGIRLLSDQELIAGKQSLQTIDNLNAGFVPKPVDISVTKVWNDNSNQDGLRPDPDTFRTVLHLERFKADQNGKATGDAEIIDAVAVVTDNQNNTYTVAYSNLLSVSYDGNEFTHYVYKVKEDAINGYSADTAEAGNGEAIINTHKPTEPVNPPVTPEEPDTPDTPSVSPAPSVTPETGKVPGDRGGKPSVSPEPKTKVKKSEAPDTGDHSNNGLYAGLLGLCVVFIVWRMLCIRKEHHND